MSIIEKRFLSFKVLLCLLTNPCLVDAIDTFVLGTWCETRISFKALAGTAADDDILLTHVTGKFRQVAEALAEIICKESNEWNPEKISETKEEILRKSSELKNEFEEEVEQKKDEYGEGTSFLKTEEKFNL